MVIRHANWGGAPDPDVPPPVDRELSMGVKVGATRSRTQARRSFAGVLSVPRRAIISPRRVPRAQGRAGASVRAVSMTVLIQRFCFILLEGPVVAR